MRRRRVLRVVCMVLLQLSCATLSGGDNAAFCTPEGVEAATHGELADFIAVHSYSTEEALADKTANQCYDPEDLHQAGFLRLRAGTLFQNSFIWKQGLFLALVALLSGIIGWNFSDAHDMDYFEHLEDALHSIIIFFMVGSTKLNSHHIGHFGSNCAAFWTVLCALIVQRRVYS